MADLNKTSSPQDKSGSGINTPELDPKTLKSERRSISDGAQAYDVAKSLETENSDRNKVNATIWRKYNGGTPFNQDDLKNAQQLWRCNFSTGFMSGIVDRVVPAPIQVIDAARYLTSVSLNTKEDSEADEKSETFRNIVTKAIRHWDGWKDLCYSTSQENVLMGGAIWAWLDDESPFPKFLRQDECFLPQGTGQSAKSVQLFSVRTSYLIHEAIEFISGGREEASVYWDVDEMVKTINAAAPKSHVQSEGENSRQYEDLIREGSIGMSFQAESKLIEVYHLLVVEPDTAKVTQYIIDYNNQHKVLFQKDDRYDSMEEVICLFTLQPGNGKFYGSKGLGKMLINPHIAIERGRNLMFDQVHMSGLLILVSDPAKQAQVSLRMSNPFMLVSTDAKIDQQQVKANVEDFLALDAKLTQLAELAAGAYIPDKISGDTGKETTATEEQLQYSREQQAKVAFLARFWAQFANGISGIQRRLCKKGATHEICKAVYKDLLEAGLKDEEIQELANMPAAEVVQDLSQVQDQQVQSVAEAYRGNPMIDQVELARRDISAKSSPRVADALIIPDTVDQTIQTEAKRQQILENSAIMSGETVEASPRDKHEIHLQTIEEEMIKAFPNLQQMTQAGDPSVPALLDHNNEGIRHAEEHVQLWEQSGGDKGTISQYQDKLKEADKALKQLAQIYGQVQNQMQQQQAEQQAQQPPEPQQPPVDKDGMPLPPPAALPSGRTLQLGRSVEPGDLTRIYAAAPDDVKREIEAGIGLEPSKVGAVGDSTLTKPQIEHVKEVAPLPPPPMPNGQ
jgi:hypothetical protein